MKILCNLINSWQFFSNALTFSYPEKNVIVISFEFLSIEPFFYRFHHAVNWVVPLFSCSATSCFEFHTNVLHHNFENCFYVKHFMKPFKIFSIESKHWNKNPNFVFCSASQTVTAKYKQALDISVMYNHTVIKNLIFSVIKTKSQNIALS